MYIYEGKSLNIYIYIKMTVLIAHLVFNARSWYQSHVNVHIVPVCDLRGLYIDKFKTGMCIYILLFNPLIVNVCLLIYVIESQKRKHLLNI